MAHVHGGGMGVVNLAFRLRRQIKQGNSSVPEAYRRLSDTSGGGDRDRAAAVSQEKAHAQAANNGTSGTSGSDAGTRGSSHGTKGKPSSRRRSRPRSSSSPCTPYRQSNAGRTTPPRSRSRTPSWHEAFHGLHLPPIREEPNLEREEDSADGPASRRTRGRAESLPAPMLPPILNAPQRHPTTPMSRVPSKPSSPLAQPVNYHQPTVTSNYFPAAQSPIFASF